MMHKIFITGIAGTIGSNLADLFVKNGYNVCGIDNLTVGNKNNLTYLCYGSSSLTDLGFTNFIKCNVVDYDKYINNFKNCDILGSSELVFLL